jgi:hypothetical protein
MAKVVYGDTVGGNVKKGTLRDVVKEDGVRMKRVGDAIVTADDTSDEVDRTFKIKSRRLK